MTKFILWAEGSEQAEFNNKSDALRLAYDYFDRGYEDIIIEEIKD